MSNRFAEASELIHRKMQTLAPSSITYRRGDNSIANILATRGSTDFEEQEDDGATSKTMDFYIAVADLNFGDGPVEPQRGDQIIADDGQVFDMLPGTANSHWRWVDSWQKTYQIHTVRRSRSSS